MMPRNEGLYHVLEQLLVGVEPSQWGYLKAEIRVINKHFAQELSNKKLSDLISALSKMSDFNDIKNLDMKNIQDILDFYFKAEKSPSPKTANKFFRKLLKANNSFEYAVQAIKNKHLPKDVEQKLLAHLERYYLAMDIMNGFFCPIGR